MIVVNSGTIIGIDGHLVRVEVDLVRRLPQTTVVGLPSGAVRESIERVRSAICAAGFEYPRLRVTVNLAPVDIRKEGTGLDLPIAVGILAAAGQVQLENRGKTLLVGELSLSGEIRPVRGVLSICMMAVSQGMEAVILPWVNMAEAMAVPGLKVYGASWLSEVATFLHTGEGLPEVTPLDTAGWTPSFENSKDIVDVRGQPMARRALEIAAAGGHNLLLMGSPGCGKTMLAARLPSILPAMSFEESLEATRVHSVAGLLPTGATLLDRRPFRAPHHSISAAGLIGGSNMHPGEASLAHKGVLFLDELPEFSRNVLELLRGPLESGEITLSRRWGTARLPASFSLVAAANLCPCGFLGHSTRPCRCNDEMVTRYLGRMVGPVLDHIDLVVELTPTTEDLRELPPGESSALVRARVESAMAFRSERSGDTLADSKMTRGAIKLLKEAPERLGRESNAESAPAVARTIADLAGDQVVKEDHVAEALAFRVPTFEGCKK